MPLRKIWNIYSLLLSFFLIAYPTIAKEKAKSAELGIKTSELNFEGIKSFLLANPEVDSVNKFVGSLPKTFRDGFSVLTESRGGIPGVTAENPRFIIHGQSRHHKESEVEPVNLMMAINKGTNTVELIEFTGEKFVPHKIEFAETSHRSKTKVKPPQFDLHLGACLSCHKGEKEKKSKEGEDAKRAELLEWAFRPNWESYPKWRGAIGSFHRAVPSKVEQSNLDKLRERAEHDEFLSLFEFSQYVENFSMDNQLFSRHLMRMNSKRVLAQMAAEPSFEQGRVAFFAALLGDEKWYEFLPEWQNATEKKKREIEKRANAKLSKNRNRVQKTLKSYYKNLDKHLEAAGQYGGAPSDFGLAKDEFQSAVGLLTYADFLFKKPNEVVANWPLIFKGYSKDIVHDYADGLSGMGYLLKKLVVPALLENVPGFNEIWNSTWRSPYNHPDPEMVLGFLHERLKTGTMLDCKEVFKKGS